MARSFVLRPNRDTVTTIGPDGSRRDLHPSDVHGRFTRARRVTAGVLLLVYLSLPWIQVGGYPAVFLDVASRRFHLFGITLAAQDLWLMFFLITGLGFSLFFITALLGRVWCGWACPQTIFLEHVFRRVERWIEGDSLRRRALAAAPWTAQKIFKRTSKQLLFILLSAGVAHLFLAYFVSLPKLWKMMTEAPREHWTAFVFISVFTGVLYFNFAWFREQLCIVLCPYGRLQSALIDENSLVIGYDLTRGEPRGKWGTPDAGACVDCNRCVQVCPTGIDIRQGLQMECIGCAACVDVCDEVMTRLSLPRGLIRYASLNGFSGRMTRWLRPRTIIYAALLLVGVAISTWALTTVRPANIIVSRMQGAPYFIDAHYVRNQFLIRVVNKQSELKRFILTLSPVPAHVVTQGFEKPVELPALGEDVRPFIVEISRANYKGGFRLHLKLASEDGRFALARESEFIGPDPKLLRDADAELAAKGDDAK